MTGLLIVTQLGLPLPVGVVGGILIGGLIGLVNGSHRALQDPAVHRDAGHAQHRPGPGARDLGPDADLLQRLPEFNQAAMGSLIGASCPASRSPTSSSSCSRAAIVAHLVLNKDGARPLHVRHRQQRGGRACPASAVGRWKAAVYVAGGLFTGLGGVMIAARLNSAQPSLGFGYELDAIAAAVIGGVSLSGGEGTILGTVIGAFIISTLTQRPAHPVGPPGVADRVTGGIVIIAVYLDIVRRRRQT